MSRVRWFSYGPRAGSGPNGIVPGAKGADIDDRGKVCTFHSYAGGADATMLLANVAWILAAHGKRVLAADWDVGSPALHRWFRRFHKGPEPARGDGLIGLFRQYERAVAKGLPRDDDGYREIARIGLHVVPIDWTFPGDGRIDLLAAGAQNPHYGRSLIEGDLEVFYDRYGGGRLLDALRADMGEQYDYALIDSPAGWGELARICTVHLADVLVECFTLSAHDIPGVTGVVKDVAARSGRRSIPVLPVPVQVDRAAGDLVDAGRSNARRQLGGLPAGMPRAEHDAYWSAVEVPAQWDYAVKEMLAVFGDRPGAPGSQLASYVALTGHLTGGEVTAPPPMDEALRASKAAEFVPVGAQSPTAIALRHAPRDQHWAEWIRQVLAAAKISCHPADQAVSGCRTLTVVSGANADAEKSRVPRESFGPRSPLVVYLDDPRPPAGVDPADSVRLAGLTEEMAVGALLELVGHPAGRVRVRSRFPGLPAAVFRAPERNPLFVGRDQDLHQVRALLLDTGTAVVLPNRPVVLQGLGGVGKSQIALEYVHRFRNAYDAVRWIDAGPGASVENQWAGLEPEAARWLFVFDGAEDLDAILPLLPEGVGGHVLVTSGRIYRGAAARTYRVGVFRRGESIALLRRLAGGTLRNEEADRIAESAGDLPIAVAAAGERHAAALPHGVWDRSFRRLADRSPAGYRLLQLCSLLAPEIAGDLVHGDTMVGHLRRYDPRVDDRGYRGGLVREIGDLALLDEDITDGRIRVHKKVQEAVRQRMSAEELAEARREVHLVLAAARPSGEVGTASTWPRFELLWPHLENSVTDPSSTGPVRDLLLDRLGYLRLTGRLAAARRLGDELVPRWEHLLGAGHEQLLRLRHTLAAVLREQGEFGAAHDLDRAVLTEQRGRLGPDHPHTLATAGGLAAGLRAHGRYAEASAIDTRTEAACVRRFGGDDPRTLLATMSRATSLRLTGDFRAAAARDRRVFARSAVVLGQDHTVTLLAGLNLGRDLRDAGDYGGSLSLLQEIVERHRKVFDEHAPAIFGAVTNLAVTARSAGRVSDAATWLEDAYEELNKALGPDSPETLACRLSRAVTLFAAGERASAEAEFIELERRYRGRYGDGHPYTVACRLNRIVAVRAAEPDLAASVALGVAKSFERALRPEHPHTLAAWANAAIFTAESGALREALHLMAPTAERTATVLGAGHPDAAQAGANLALIRDALGEGSADDVGVALGRLVTALDAEHPVVRAVREGRYLPRVLDPHPF